MRGSRTLGSSSFANKKNKCKLFFDFVSFPMESSYVCVLQINKHRLFFISFSLLYRQSILPLLTAAYFDIHHCYDVCFYFFAQMGIANDLGITIAVSCWRKEVTPEICGPDVRIDTCIFAQLHPRLSTCNR